jgi:hypothetical protein
VFAGEDCRDILEQAIAPRSAPHPIAPYSLRSLEPMRRLAPSMKAHDHDVKLPPTRTGGVCLTILGIGAAPGIGVEPAAPGIGVEPEPLVWWTW